MPAQRWLNSRRSRDTERKAQHPSLWQGVTLVPAQAAGRGPEEIEPSLLQLKGWSEVGSEKIEFLPYL